ncbi:hypothetical protein PBRA_009587 [Plasmodiophora brassicae]|uniref:LRRNT domain-containing protein n=1 Tax=Plasmodiophora brassicae TaxID=37360 RepID=A0A0G4IJ02_PLABS|nr:hypothetical protein PBRA_009587 [Plasmodiophora brassicae]
MTRGGLRATGVALVLHLGMMVAIVGPARPSASVCNFRCICDWYQGACIPPNLNVTSRTVTGGVNASWFAGVPSLTTYTALYMDGNKITGVDAGSFDALTALQTLSLANCLISALPSAVFQNTNALSYLNVAANRITSLPPGVFSALPLLTYLDLARNAITSPITAATFSSNPRLNFLDIGSNRITSIASDAFNQLTVLQTLSLQANPLTTLPSFVSNLQLQSLNLGSTSVTNVPSLNPDAFATLSALTALYLDNNRLASLSPTQFQNNAMLQTLGIQRNLLGQIPSGLFTSLTALNTLSMFSCSLTILDADMAFSTLTALAALDISNNKLSVMPSSLFLRNTLLTFLDIAHNGLAILDPNLLSPLSLLTTLKMHTLPVPSVPPSFFASQTRLASLEIFNLPFVSTLDTNLFRPLVSARYVDISKQLPLLSCVPRPPPAASVMYLTGGLPVCGTTSSTTTTIAPTFEPIAPSTVSRPSRPSSGPSTSSRSSRPLSHAPLPLYLLSTRTRTSWALSRSPTMMKRGQSPPAPSLSSTTPSTWLHDVIVFAAVSAILIIVTLLLVIAAGQICSKRLTVGQPTTAPTFAQPLPAANAVLDQSVASLTTSGDFVLPANNSYAPVPVATMPSYSTDSFMTLPFDPRTAPAPGLFPSRPVGSRDQAYKNREPYFYGTRPQ